MPITPAGQVYRDALRGDCHTHSTWSDGGAEIDAMAATARALGHEYIVLTDHSARLTIAHGLNRERLERQLDVLADLNERFAPFRILSGMEVDILEDGSLDLDDDLLERLDVVVASVHSKLRMERAGMTERMVMAVANPHVDILGHCTGRLIGKRPESTFDADYVFAACAQFGTAVEINCRPERLDPPRPLLDLAIEYGCWFSIDTDAHATGQLEWQPHGCDRAAERGVPLERVINTLSADDLLAWTAGWRPVDHPGPAAGGRCRWWRSTTRCGSRRGSTRARADRARTSPTSSWRSDRPGRTTRCATRRVPVGPGSAVTLTSATAGCPSTASSIASRYTSRSPRVMRSAARPTTT